MKKLILIFVILVFCGVSISAQVKKSVVCTAGKLSTILTETEKSTITDLTITGTIDFRDFHTMRNMLALKIININKATVSAFDTEPANKIPDSAFLGCSGLTSINIPESVTSIGDWAFSNCSSLTSISIPESVTSIGIQAYLYCSGQITVSENNQNYSSLDGVLFNKTKTELIQCPTQKTGNYTIPSSVTSIGNWAFFYCDNLTSISVPSSLTSIGNEAFFYCSALTSISIPSSVTSIGNDAYRNCRRLTSISIPSSVTTICDGTFSGCSSLTSISIPSSVTSIGPYVFYGCYSLTSINIPSSITSIRDQTFFGCSGLTSFNIPSSVTSIGWAAFSFCSSLTSISIPSSVTSIGDRAFFGCSGLSSISIPTSVTTISYDAFGNCGGLTAINIPSSVTYIGGGAFSGCSSLNSIYSLAINPVKLTNPSSVFEGVNKSTCTLYVPNGSKDAYSKAEGWKDFINIIEIEGLFVSQNSISLSNREQTAYIDVTSSNSWSVKSNTAWLTVNPAKGSGIATIGLSALANTTNEVLRAIVTVSAEGQPDQIITVTQNDITGIHDNVITSFKIYPNPASDFIYVGDNNFISNRYYEILDINGKLIQKGQLSESRITTGNLLSGIYFVKIYDGNTVSTQKFIKQ